MKIPLDLPFLQTEVSLFKRLIGIENTVKHITHENANRFLNIKNSHRLR
jgi:hypothetical protein